MTPDLADPSAITKLGGLKIALNRYLLFWGCLLGLILGTLASWQFRFKETGTVFWRNHSLELWSTEGPNPKVTPPTWQEEDQLLNFSSPDKTRSAALKSWKAHGVEYLKIRLTHRTTEDFDHRKTKSTFPIIIQIVTFDEAYRLLPIDDSIISYVPPGTRWQTIEAVAHLPDQADHFSLSISENTNSGSYQLGELDVASANQRAWVPFTTPLLFMAWTGWILWAIRRRKGESRWGNPASIFCSLWIVLWGALLVFPRVTDIPRPFFETFNTSSEVSDWQQIESETFKRPTATQSSPIKNADEPKKTAGWKDALRWLKHQSGGRFLLHLGAMGLFGGILLILMPLRQAYPFILAMAIGVELIPWLWLRDLNGDDGWDMISYLLAIAIVTPVAARLRRRWTTVPD